VPARPGGLRADAGCVALGKGDPGQVRPERFAEARAKQAMRRVGYLGLPYLFFVDDVTDRGSVRYVWYDVHYGLVTPPVPACGRRNVRSFDRVFPADRRPVRVGARDVGVDLGDLAIVSRTTWRKLFQRATSTPIAMSCSLLSPEANGWSQSCRRLYQVPCW
jgi:hypothetical protein